MKVWVMLQEKNAIHGRLHLDPFKPKILRCLLQASEDLGQPDRNQRTPLDLASHTQNFKALTLLLEAGATPALNLHWRGDSPRPIQNWLWLFLRSRCEKQDLQKINIPESSRILKRL